MIGRTSALAFSMILFQGKDDPLVPWAGGEVSEPLFNTKLGRVIGVKATAALFAGRCGCSVPPVVKAMPNAAIFDGTTVDRLTYPGCAGGAEVVLYRVNGGGHTWPSGLQYLPASIVGKTTRDISADDLMWEFFSRHSL
jgi:polyhydroxybutyrate depolymerase